MHHDPPRRPPKHFDISLPLNADPAEVSCLPGDTITWINNTGFTITQFTLPSCVSGQPISHYLPLYTGDSAGPYHVKADPKNKYPYDYFVDVQPDEGVVIEQTGTIDIS